MKYSRQQPSARYTDLIGMYRVMHEQGDSRLNIAPENMFPGQSLPPHAGRIKQLIDKFGVQSVLDYGAGKGRQYLPMQVSVEGGLTYPDIPSFWGVTVRCYDPAYGPHNELPSEKYDAVVCTDVLEHCPEDDIAWIVDELFSYATKFVYANVACYPAKKTLPNGENAHATIQPVAWWKEHFEAASAKFGGIPFLVLVEQSQSSEQGGGIKTSVFASPGILKTA